VQPAFDAAAKGMVKLRLTPNAITVAALCIGISSGVLAAFGLYFPALALLWLSGLLDVLDGTVARLTGKTSKLGAYMDLIFDRLVEASVVLGFYLSMPRFALASLVFFISVIFNFTTFTVAGALFQNSGEKSMHYDVGIAERTETFIVFSLMLLFPALGGTILMVFNGIIFLTGAIRFYKIIQYSKNEGGTS
jgi:phosphatidylglycerophosphate synthase